MATTSNTYTGNGSNKLFSITFPYLETTDIFVFVNSTLTTAYTFANATTIEMTAAPANGATVYIARVTDDTTLQATFFPGSSIKAADLNLDFDQVLYIAQETTNEAQAATASSNAATTTANTALSNSAAAVSTANTASSNASAAVSTANTASTNASNAVTTANTASSNATTAVNTANAATSTANTASSNASAAVSTANTASSNASAAVSTANTASTNASAAVTTANAANSTANTASTNASNAVTTANAAVTTANTANTNSNTAVTTANAAAAAVANAVLYTTVANVAAIPGSPANNAAVEVTNSTGIESFTPLSGLPAGFIGSSGLSVRIIYQTSGATWTWIQYFPNDPETRYLKLAGGTLTGALASTLGTAALPSLTFTGDTNTGIYSPGADQVGISTGGTRRLVVDANGNIAFGSGTVPQYSFLFNKNITGAVSSFGIVSQGTIQSDVTTSALLYNTFANTQATAFTLTDLHHYRAQQSTFGAGSTVTNQYGFSAANTLTGATNNYGFYSGIASGTNRWNFYAAGTADSYFASNNFIWANGGSEKARVDSTGRLLVGTSTSITTLIAAGLQVQSTGANAYTSIGRWDNNAANPGLILNKSRGGSVGTLGVVQINDSLGEINFQGDDGSAFVAAARIQAQVDGTPGTNDMPGRLVFSTTADGAASLTTRMTITSAGLVGIGTTGPGELLEVLGNIRSTNGFVRTSGSSANAVTTRGFRQTIDGTEYLAIYHDNNGAVFNVNSSERARIDSSGRLLVGTSTAQGSSVLQLQTSGGAVVRIARDLPPSSLGSGNFIGSINFTDNAGNDYSRIIAEADGTAGSGDYPGRLVFSTTADGASSPTERFRISSTGAQSSVIPGGSTLYPSFGCRAWVNFDGTGTVAIRASGNVSSITDHAVGVYTVNYTTALPDQSGAPIAFCSDDGVSNRAINMQSTNTAFNLTTSCRVTIWGGTTSYDSTGVYFAIFR